jgi:hypothetical protein
MSSETITPDQLTYRACKLGRITRDEPGAGELAKMARLIEFLRPHLVALEAPRQNEAVSFDDWYVEHAFDYEKHPLGSRECGLQREAWDAALAAKPTGDTCTCPTCGDWYAAEDIDRMVKEISDALGSTATHPKLCDIVVETVRAIGARPGPSSQAQDVTDGLVEVACRAYYNSGVPVRPPVFEGMRAALVAALALQPVAAARTPQEGNETLDEEVRLALQYSRNHADASPYLNATGKEHILGLCTLVEKLHAALARPRPMGDAKSRHLPSDLRAFVMLLDKLADEWCAEEGETFRPAYELRSQVAAFVTLQPDSRRPRCVTEAAPTGEQAGEVIERKYSVSEMLAVADELDDVQQWKAAEILRFYTNPPAAQDATRPRPVGVPDGFKARLMGLVAEAWVHGKDEATLGREVDVICAVLATAPEVSS